MPDTSNRELTVKGWLTNYDLADRVSDVRRRWYESVGAITILEKVMRSGDPSDELFVQYKERISESRKWHALHESLKMLESFDNRDFLDRWIDTHGVESLPWRGWR